MALIAGADGCGPGWVVVRADTQSGVLHADWVVTGALPDLEFDVLGIDIPIGLMQAGRREADGHARRFLGAPRASSVFPAPIRPAVAATTRAQASAITARADGRRVGAQAFGIYPKVHAVDCLLRGDAALAKRVYEVHPEVSFAAWAGHPMRHSKKTPAGSRERRRLIAAHFGAGAFTRLRDALLTRRLRVPIDDLADAFATLWTAHRIHDGVAARFPHEPRLDACGLPMHIWY